MRYITIEHISLRIILHIHILLIEDTYEFYKNSIRNQENAEQILAFKVALFKKLYIKKKSCILIPIKYKTIWNGLWHQKITWKESELQMSKLQIPREYHGFKKVLNKNNNIFYLGTTLMNWFITSYLVNTYILWMDRGREWHKEKALYCQNPYLM